MEYHGFKIEENEHGTFNVPGINCFSSWTLATAKQAIDRYCLANSLDSKGIPVRVGDKVLWAGEECTVKQRLPIGLLVLSVPRNWDTCPLHPALVTRIMPSLQQVAA